MFNIADPFSDGAVSPADPFTPESTTAAATDAFEARFPKLDAFDVDDTFGEDFAKADLVNGNKMDSSVNLFNGKEKFSDSNANAMPGKTFNIDPFLAQSAKMDSKPDIFISTEGLFGKKKGGDRGSSKGGVSDDLQLAWAAKESIRLEQERRQREEQERSDLEMAIALSKKENSEKRSFRNLLRRGRNTPTT